MKAKNFSYLNKKSSKPGCGLLTLLLMAVLLFGEVRCIYKAVSCNWEPVGKAEVIYTGASLTGLGSIVGYFNIEDK